MSADGLPRHTWDYVKAFQAFCQASRLGSISRAAEQVMSSQPTVSRQVFALEEECRSGAIRASWAAHRTHAGETFCRLAVPLVPGMNRVRDTSFALHHGVTHGVLAIGAGRDVATCVLPEYLNRFPEPYPAVKTDLRTGTGKQRLDWLRAYELDLVVAAMDVPPLAVEFHPVLASGLVLTTPEDHPLAGRESVTIKEVAAYPFIGHTSTHCVWQVVEAFMRPHGVAPDVAVEVDGWGMLTSYVEASVGIAFVPDYCLRENDPVRKHSFKDPIPPRRYGAVTRRRRLLAPAASRFLRIMVPDLPEVSEAP